LSCYWR